MASFKISRGEKIFHVSNYIFLILLSLIFILPFFIVISTSLVSQAEATRRGTFILWPERIDFSSYNMLLSQGSAVFRAYGITIFRVVVGTFLQLVCTTAMAYALSKKSLPGRKTILMVCFISMIFPPLLVPRFLVVKSLGLLDSVWSMIIPALVSTYFLFIMKAFFSQIPQSIEEAAIIDGCNPVTLLYKIILPLSLPSIATIGLFYAIWHWNQWFDAAIFINSQDKLPLQNLMRGILLQSSAMDLNSNLYENVANQPPVESLKCAMIVVSTLPVLCIYPFIQKYFVKGFLVGSVKE